MNLKTCSKRLEWVVTSQEAGVKLLAFLTQRLENQYSARSIKRLIERHRCLVNDRIERFASALLGRGDGVRLHLDDESCGFRSPYSVPGQLEPERILYEDEALFVYNKPAGITSDERGILQLLNKGTSSLQLIHRLDRDTTGILLLAKCAAAFDNLVDQFKHFRVHKCYRALVDGEVGEKGKIENHLGKKRAYAGQTVWGAVAASRGSYACTEWKPLKKGRMATLLACSPKTGRTHQIRVHMAEMGHPILGDFQYGACFHCPYRPSRYLLHAEEMRFCHPLTGDELFLTAPVPDDFKIAERQLFKE